MCDADLTNNNNNNSPYDPQFYKGEVVSLEALFLFYDLSLLLIEQHSLQQTAFFCHVLEQLFHATDPYSKIG